MTITATDVKLLASERFTDDADGGGFLTATVITDGVENNVFPDISDVERATGANAFRKVYAAIATATTEQYRSAHVILDAIPGDPGVTGLLRAASGVSEVRSSFITAADASATGTQDGGAGWYSTKVLQTARAAGDSTVKVDSLSASLVPVSSVSSPVSGTVASASGAVTTGTALIPAGAALPLSPAADGTRTYFYFKTLFAPGAVSGGYTQGGIAKTLTDTVDADGYSSLFVDAATGADATVTNVRIGNWQGGGASNYDGWSNQAGNAAITGDTAVYAPSLEVSLPLETVEFTWAVGMSLVQFVTLPFTPARGSETITYTPGFSSSALEQTTRTNGSEVFHPVVEGVGGTFHASVNRATRVVSLFFSSAPRVGSKVTVRFARDGFAQSLGSGAVPGAFAGNQLTVTSSAGYLLQAAYFALSTGAEYTLRSDKSIVSNTNNAVVGAFNPATGKLQLPAADGTTVTTWRAVEVSTSVPTSSVVDAPLPPNLDPATVTVTGTKVAGGAFTATANASGTFATALVTGTYSKLTGKLSLSFSEAVAAPSLAYSANAVAYTPVSAAVAGVNPASFPTSGEVAVFHAGDLVVVHNTQALAPQTVTNAQTVNVGRTNVSEFRVIGANGAEIFAGWSGDKATGIVTFSNVTGYSQPVTLSHRVENVRMVVSASVDGTLALSSPLSHTFPLGTSYVSSALVLGDMFARAHGGFQLATWNNVWADAATGSAILADYNEAAHPIQVNNSGAITERWVVVFTNATTFTVSGEQVGVIATGNTVSDCAPLNPATGTPYFSIPATGWGSGWAIGNAYRFNTTGASSPFWVVRSIRPSAPAGLDKLTLALRGSVNV